MVALKHGAYSPAKLAEHAEVVHASLLAYAPWVAEPHYAPSVSRYLEATAREQLAHAAYLAGDPTKTRMLEAATAASRLAWVFADQLGLTPAGHAKLKMLVAGGEHAEQSLADLAAEGRQAAIDRAAREAVTIDASTEETS